MESSHFYKVKLRSIDHLRGYQQRSLGKICKEAKVLIQFPDFEDSVGDTVLIITGGISAIQKAIGLINRHLEVGLGLLLFGIKLRIFLLTRVLLLRHLLAG